MKKPVAKKRPPLRLTLVFDGDGSVTIEKNGNVVRLDWWKEIDFLRAALTFVRDKQRTGEII